MLKSRHLGGGVGHGRRELRDGWRHGRLSAAVGNSCGSMVLRGPYAALRRSKTATAAAGDPLGRDPRLARVEAVLFLADEPLSTRKISDLANLADGTEARTLIRRLNNLYDRQGTAFRAEEAAGGFQLLTRRKFAGWLRRLVRTHVEARLSAPALETLAVVAYRQPVARAEIETIRGVQCDEMLRQLLERELVKIVGRSEELGRPFLYGTTKRFLQFFGLRHLDELPRAAELNAGRVGASPEASAVTNDDDVDSDSIQDTKEESEVKIRTTTKPAETEEDLKRRRLARLDEVRAEDEEEDDDWEEDEDDDEEDEEDEEEEEDDDFDDDDFDDDWEEVDEDDEDDEDDDWDDDDDDEDEDEDDWDDDEEEEDDDDEE